VLYFVLQVHKSYKTLGEFSEKHLLYSQTTEWIIMQNTTGNARDFGIKLANDEIWQFISTSETYEWLEKLRIIMGLDEATGLEGQENHKITFLKNIIDERISNGKDFIRNSNEIYMLNTGPLRIYRCQNTSHVICEISNTDFPGVELFKMVQSVLPIYMRVLCQGGLPLHAALIERNGTGIAIAAPGGTGKSTCARRIPRPWHTLCDDELLIVRDKRGAYQAHPFPTWSRCNTQKLGETWNVQTHVPISAIFFLKKSQKDKVNSLSFSQSAPLIYKLSLPVFDRILEFVDQNDYTTTKKFIFENACDIAQDIPAFILEASLEGKLWEAIDKALLADPKEGYIDARMSPSTY
jgi:SynChlorMet cassette protein ScmC